MTEEILPIAFSIAIFYIELFEKCWLKKLLLKKKTDDDEETVVLNTLNGMWESAPLQILLIRKSASYN